MGPPPPSFRRICLLHLSSPFLLINSWPWLNFHKLPIVLQNVWLPCRSGATGDECPLGNGRKRLAPLERLLPYRRRSWSERSPLPVWIFYKSQPIIIRLFWLLIERLLKYWWYGNSSVITGCWDKNRRMGRREYQLSSHSFLTFSEQGFYVH